MFPEHGRDVETLMQRADIAMYSAKARGVGHEVYSASRDGHSRARLALIGELPDAIESGQIVVHYQPKFDLETGEIAGAEALVRWDHPQFGLLGPGAFLPLAEQTGLMRPLTLRVLDDALGPVRPLARRGPHAPRRRQPRRAEPARPRPARATSTNCWPSGTSTRRCCSWRSPRRSSPPTRCA